MSGRLPPLNLLNVWAVSRRNARALAAALVMFGAIGFMLSLRCNPMIERESALGLVLAVEATGLRPPGSGEPMSRVLAATPDSTEIRLLLPPPVPRLGDFVPLTIERYKKGDVVYLLDLQRWRVAGPL